MRKVGPCIRQGCTKIGTYRTCVKIEKDGVLFSTDIDLSLFIYLCNHTEVCIHCLPTYLPAYPHTQTDAH